MQQSRLKGGLYGLVPAYILILTRMHVLAVQHRHAWPFLGVGASCYVLSDLLLGLNLFLMPLHSAVLACVWPLYYGGQVLIVLSFGSRQNRNLNRTTAISTFLG